MNGKTVLSNMAWKFAERVGAQLVQLIVSIVLARILLPEDYGIIAIVNVFLGILEIFIDNGLGNALIQKKESDDLDFSTVFFANIVLCIFLYIVIWVFSPFIGGFYKLEKLSKVLRVTSLLIIVSSVKNIQQAYVSKNLIFKKFFIATLGGTVTAGVVGIWMALSGYGVWALVAQKLVNYTIDTIILWITVKWRPTFKFSFERLKSLFSYGWKLLASSLLNQVMADFRQLIVGKVYSATDLALYNRGDQFPSLLMVNITSTVDSVLFPVLSNSQYNKEEIKRLVSSSIALSEFILMPILVGLMACSNHLVGVFLTHKWDGCVPYIIILSFSYLFSPMYLSSMNAIKAIGRSDTYLRFKIIQNLFSLVSVIIMIRIGPIAIAISLLLTNLFGQIYSMIVSKKYIDYSAFDALKDNWKTILISIFMGAVTFLAGYIVANDHIALVIQIVLGVAVYVLLSLALKSESMSYLISLLRSMIRKH